MKIIFTCGGTAGHINPAIALAHLFQERKPDCEILFVGAKAGIEERLVPKDGFRLETITIGSFWRKMTISGVKHNLSTLRKLQVSKRECRDILDKFQPDMVVGTGGYASYPIVREAARRGIPTAVHESNAVPGLTTRRLAQYVDCVMVGFSDIANAYVRPERVVVTGTPVRGAFFAHSRREARQLLGIPADLPVVLSYWGSLGANQMNRYMVDMIEGEARGERSFYHIHGAGQDYARMLLELEKREVTLPPHIEIREYIDNMPMVMAAADLVLCRGGASTISELMAISKPSIIVPSPNVTHNHQEKNARVLADAGLAMLILESDCDGQVLSREVCRLLSEKEERSRMEGAIAAAGMPDAADRIYQTLMKLLQRS